MKNPISFNLSTADYDLAVEAHSLLRGDANTEVSGVTQEVKHHETGDVTIIEIINDEGAAAMGRSIGTYITMNIPEIIYDYTGSLVEPISIVLTQYLRPLLPKPTLEHPILVIGLGNWQTTPDALGPQVISHTQPTRHFYDIPNNDTADLMPLCAFTPGVLGNTGIDTSNIVKGVVDEVHPCCLIVIDALAAASISRINTTIQLSNGGIRPGSGIIKHNKPINKDTMGIPVIAVGIPTVVNAKIIIQETLNMLFQMINSNPAIDQGLGDKIAQNLLSAYDGELIVTPKEIDHLIPLNAKIIAAAIALSIHPGANKDNYNLYMQ